MIPLGPDEKQVRLENLDVSECSDLTNDVSTAAPDRPEYSGGRDGSFFNHVQMLTGICGRRESTDAIWNNVPITLRPTSSVYGSAEAAAAHLATIFSSYGSSSQDTWVDAGVIIQSREGVCVLGGLMMNGFARCHVSTSGPKAMAARKEISTIRCFPLRPRRAAYGKSAIIALCLDWISPKSVGLIMVSSF